LNQALVCGIILSKSQGKIRLTKSMIDDFLMKYDYLKIIHKSKKTRASAPAFKIKSGCYGRVTLMLLT